MDKIRELDVTLTGENQEETARMVVQAIKPDWNLGKIKVERVKIGFVNVTVKVLETDYSSADAIIIRSLEYEKFKLDLHSFKQTWKFTSENNLSPKLLCFITNGVCVEFINGRTIDFGTEDIANQPKVYKLIAMKLAEYHSRKVFRNAKIFGLKAMNTTLGALINHDKWNEYLHSLDFPDDFKKEVQNRKHLLEEEARITTKLKEKGYLEDAFSHMELNLSNMILFDTYPHIYFFDFDLSCLAYSQVDIGWFFSCFVKFDKIDFRKSYPKETFQRDFLREYLIYRRIFDSENSANINYDDVIINDNDVTKLMDQVRKAMMITLLRWTSSGVLLHTVEKKEHERFFIEIGTCAWRDYKKWKESDPETKDW